MRQRLAAVLLFALVVSGAASFVIYKFLGEKLAQPQKLAASKLFVARFELGTGTLIKDTDITEVDWTGAVPARALLKKEEIVGRGVVSTIYANEPILADRLAAEGAGAGLAATIPIGMRAVALRVNDVVGVGGFVTPGMKVDVLAMGTPSDSASVGGTMSKTLLQNIEVLSAGQQIQRDAEGKPLTVPVVNLLLTPEQAELVSLASNQTKIQLVLRNPLDKEEAQTKGVAFRSIFSDKPIAPVVKASGGAPVRRAAPPPPPPAQAKKKEEPPPVVVQVIHGGRRAEVKFEAEEENKDEKKAGQ
jgi:pilus assembly protein CpaB